jgi:hypothetical protein
MANNFKRIIFYFFISVFVSFPVFSGDFNQYLDNDLDGKSGYYMSGNTKRRLRSYHLNDSKPIYGAALDSKHDNFDDNKNNLIEKWEKYSEMGWPVYNVATNNRNIGDKYDAHHIIPQSHNGPNKWWNLFPLTNAEHHQVHSNGTNCSLLFPGSRGNGR